MSTTYFREVSLFKLAIHGVEGKELSIVGKTASDELVILSFDQDKGTLGQRIKIASSVDLSKVTVFRDYIVWHAKGNSAKLHTYKFEGKETSSIDLKVFLRLTVARSYLD
jgi:hypothetical protein